MKAYQIAERLKFEQLLTFSNEATHGENIDCVMLRARLHLKYVDVRVDGF